MERRAAVSLAAAGLGVLAWTLVPAPVFRPPGPEERRAALGPLDGLGEAERRAYAEAGHEPLPWPGARDWLVAHPEAGQTFEQYLASRPPAADGGRRVLYLAPMGAQAPALEPLVPFAEAFFGLPVAVLPEVDVPPSVRTRPAPRWRVRQLFVPDLLDLLRARLPRDAQALLAFTGDDLYPDASWSYVFGLASLSDRVGVFSTARHGPPFVAAADAGGRGRERAMKLLAHEAGHMFGLAHCVHWRCLMNGANHLREFDARPLHLCPVCLRKLRHAAGFDPARRYERLERAFREAGLEEEAGWAGARRRSLEPGR